MHQKFTGKQSESLLKAGLFSFYPVKGRLSAHDMDMVRADHFYSMNVFEIHCKLTLILFWMCTKKYVPVFETQPC
jgi:hypothetical protein